MNPTTNILVVGIVRGLLLQFRATEAVRPIKPIAVPITFV